MRTNSTRLLVISAMIIFAGVFKVQAYTVITWDGDAGDGNWNTTNNWSVDNIPDTLSEAAWIDNNPAVTSTVTLVESSAYNETYEVGAITVDTDDTFTFQVKKKDYKNGYLNTTNIFNSGTLNLSASATGNAMTLSLTVYDSDNIFNTGTGVINMYNNSGRNRLNVIMNVDAQNQNDGDIFLSMTGSADRDTCRFRLNNSGDFVNNGYILLQDTHSSSSSYTQFRLNTASAVVTLGGNGSIELDVGTVYNSTYAQIVGAGGNILTNGVNHAIFGDGLLGGSAINLYNAGLIQAYGSNTVLQVKPNTVINNLSSGRMVAAGYSSDLAIGSSGDTFTNDGLLEARTGSRVVLGASTLNLNGELRGGGSVTNSSALDLSTMEITPGDSVNADGTGDSTVGMLSVDVGLTLGGTTELNYQLSSLGVAGTDYDTIVVNGDLTVDGVLNIDDLGGTGVYRLISCSGTLTDNGLVIGTAPVAGYSFDVGSDYVDLIVPPQGSVLIIQ